jgi:hypothetical protein
MEIQINKYDVVQTGFYDNKIQMKLGYYNKNGEFKARFLTVKSKDGTEKFTPITFTFDDTDTAVAFCDVCKSEMMSKKIQEKDVPEQPPLQDVPF